MCVRACVCVVCVCVCVQGCLDLTADCMLMCNPSEEASAAVCVNVQTNCDFVLSE